MLLLSLTAIAPLTVIAAPTLVERAIVAQEGNKIDFSWANSRAGPGTVHQYSEAYVTPQYYLRAAAGVSWTPADRFTTIVIESNTASNTSGTLVQSYSGQSVTPLPTTEYSITNPAREYANYMLPQVAVGSAPVQLCVYVFQEPGTLASVSNPSRAGFDVEDFVRRLGLGNALAANCVQIINGVAGSMSSATTGPSKTTSSSLISGVGSYVSSASSSISIKMGVSSMSSTSNSASSAGRPTSSSASLPSSSSMSSKISSAGGRLSMSSTAPASAVSNGVMTSSRSTPLSASMSSSATPAGPLPAFQTTVVFNGQKYINKGLVGFGAISGDAVDSTGSTIGGIGSAIALESFQKSGSVYTGVMAVQPDRGHNTQVTTDYIARRHRIQFTLTPYYAAKDLDYSNAKSTFNLTYLSSLLYHEADGTPTTGLDALGIRAAANGQPVLPIANSHYNRISTDAEGLVLNADGSSWVSDEYGPYIYKYSAAGSLLQVIQPPTAVLPLKNGHLNFTSSQNPDTGRVANQGFEGLTASSDGKTLYALLQSGLVQDLDSSGEGRYTRLFAYDVSVTPAVLKHSWILELPVTNGKGKALATSDFHYLSENTFLVLSRDGKGNGNDDSDSKHKDFILYSVAGATDIASTGYTTGTKAVAPGGVLASGVKAAKGTEFIDMIDDTQLERFGLHNDGKFTLSLIDGKWESIALANVQDPDYPNDYFLFSFADNDFITLNGHDSTGSYSDPYAVSHGYSLDNQALVWRVTLP